MNNKDKQLADQHYQKYCSRYGKEEVFEYVGSAESFYNDVWKNATKEQISAEFERYFETIEDWQRDC